MTYDLSLKSSPSTAGREKQQLPNVASFQSGSFRGRGWKGVFRHFPSMDQSSPQRGGDVSRSLPLLLDRTSVWAPFKRTNERSTPRTLTLTDWLEIVLRPPYHASCPTPSHTRWLRPAKWRPRSGFAEAGSLSHSLFGRPAPRAGGRGPGGDRGTCVAGPRDCAQPAPPPPGPGPVLARSHPIGSQSPPGLTHCLAVVRHTRPFKAEVSSPDCARLHFRDVWLLPSQPARLQNRDSWSGIWPPFPLLRLPFSLTHFFLRAWFPLSWRPLTSLPN